MSCSACEPTVKRRHTEEDWAHHPLRGHGCYDGRWTCEEARLAHLADIERLTKAAEARKDGQQ